MPLRKLWNSIRGTEKSAASQELDGPKTPTTVKKKQAAEKRGILGVISGGPHAGLCKQIKSLQASKVLEIGVGDGTRAAEVIRTLRSRNADAAIHYSVIDQFEMGGGPITLKAYHQQLRTIGVTPNLIPMPVVAGIQRIATTVGAIDLILLDSVELSDVESLLPRVTTNESMVLRFHEEKWTVIPTSAPVHRKAA